ncbi:hypothetical protein SODALDRAFT_333849 [Sodiomyces alkalinus F11]|uniref:Uncharacterized protein n=1 Tax=Sodiomyces alkalinus (strain CBS 110278 / VKM F-3762 / F11) TaxID=1314773 RepID=A0A3N2PUC3_SODAK|nr:hypothetical protein SODALDRAFT_333849 [Sodiomyces alkalinus F11]ROT38081.1 hypothetical protein SODALDRAFT_333849 [Sodiomyces alkalinus F11]
MSRRRSHLSQLLFLSASSDDFASDLRACVTREVLDHKPGHLGKKATIDVVLLGRISAPMVLRLMLVPTPL